MINWQANGGSQSLFKSMSVCVCVCTHVSSYGQLPLWYWLSWFLADKLLLIPNTAGWEIGWALSGHFGADLKILASHKHTRAHWFTSVHGHTEELMLAHSMHQLCPHAVTQYGVWPAVHVWILPVFGAEIWVHLGLLECMTCLSSEIFDSHTPASFCCWQFLPRAPPCQDSSATTISSLQQSPGHLSWSPGLPALSPAF